MHRFSNRLINKKTKLNLQNVILITGARDASLAVIGSVKPGGIIPYHHWIKPMTNIIVKVFFISNYRKSPVI